MIKKILVYVLVVIVLIIAGALVFGLLNPSISYETRLEINKPRDVVWKYFTDETKMSEWLDGFQKIELISGNKNEVGSQYRMTFVEDGREIVMTETVKEFNPGERFAFHLENEVISVDSEITLTDVEGKTLFTEKDTAVGGNILWRILFAAMKSTFQEKS